MVNIAWMFLLSQNNISMFYREHIGDGKMIKKKQSDSHNSAISHPDIF